MEMLLPNAVVETLQYEDMQWFVETAAVNMLTEEVRRPELIDMPTLYGLARMGYDKGTAFVAKINGEPVGAIGGLVLPHVFNPKIICLTEIFWYVLPEYRNTRAGVLLLNEFTSRGNLIADETTLCLLHTSQVNIKSLNKRGYFLGEYAFRKEN